MFIVSKRETCLENSTHTHRLLLFQAKHKRKKVCALKEAYLDNRLPNKRYLFDCARKIWVQAKEEKS